MNFPFNRTLFFGLFIAFQLISCERTIDIDFPEAEQMIVVEGYVEQGKKPYVFLTKSLSYTGEMPGDYEELFEFIVSDAIVEVSDGIITEQLEFKYDPSFSELPYYEAPTMIGKEGGKYTLKIIAEGKTLTSCTTISPVIPLDKIWFQLEGNSDSLGYCWAHLTDPDTTGNCYRLLTKRINKDKYFVGVNGILHSDKFLNGLSYDFFFGKGLNPYGQAETYEGNYFLNKDTVVIKFCTIDKQSMWFWQDIGAEAKSGQNPFTSHSSVTSNIEGGGLGIWCGYGASYDTVYCYSY